MALKEQLSKFNKQKEKCQSTLSSIASSRAGPSRLSVSAAIRDHNPSVTRGKFSENTKQLQHINNIRNSAVGAQMKLVIELLSKTRQALTAEQINEASYVDMNANEDVFDNLRNNPKVHYDGRKFSYKAKHNVKDKSQLLSLVNKHPIGIDVVDLKDAYLNVMKDLQALEASGDIRLLLSCTNSQEGMAYPNDFKGQIQVDDEFKALFRDMDIPRDMLEVEKELLKIGLKPATNTAERRAAAQIQGISNKPKEKKKKKKQEISKRTKLTNAHLPELFQSLNASSSRN